MVSPLLPWWRILPLQSLTRCEHWPCLAWLLCTYTWRVCCMPGYISAWPREPLHHTSGPGYYLQAWSPDDFACSCTASPMGDAQQQSHVPVCPVVLNCGHVHCGLATSAGLHQCSPPWDILRACSKCSAPVLAPPAALPQVGIAGLQCLEYGQLGIWSRSFFIAQLQFLAEMISNSGRGGELIFTSMCAVDISCPQAAVARSPC